MLQREEAFNVQNALKVLNTSQNMRMVHGATVFESRNKIQDFGLQKKRELLSKDVRKTEMKENRKKQCYMCNYNNCRSEVQRIGNHLRQS